MRSNSYCFENDKERGIRMRPSYVLLVSYYPPHWIAGAEVQALALARHLAKRGFEVHVVTRSHRIWPSLDSADGLFVHRVFYVPTLLLRTTYYISAFFKALQAKPQLVHGVTLFPNGVIASIIGALIRKPTIAHASGSDVFRENRLVRMLLWRVIFRFASVIVVKAECMKVPLIRSGCPRHKLVTVTNGVDLERFGLARSYSREPVGVDKTATILYVGRLESVKGISTLLKAYAQIYREFTDSRLLLVGDGNDARRLREVVADMHLGAAVHFCGWVHQSEVPKYFQAADIFVLPSLFEGCPNVLLEAMAAGLPIVASAVGGVPELVRDGTEGFLVLPGDVETLADRLKSLLTDEGLRKEMSNNSRKRATEFEMTRVNDKIFGLCNELLRDKHAYSRAVDLSNLK